MGALSEFIIRLWDHAWWFLTNIVLVIQPLFEFLPGNQQKRIRENRFLARILSWRPPSWAIHIFAVSGVVIAAFLAFQDEYNALQQEKIARPVSESPYHWTL